MKPIKSLIQDDAALKEIGRASIQIVHDLKNQLNGLKLYATFLRKRLEKERDQLEKNVANITRQLADETFLGRAPAHVVEQIRTKLSEYEAQLIKVRAALDGLAA